MADISIEIKGLDELIKQTKGAKSVITKEIGKAIVDSSIVLQAAAFREVPFDTGNLQKKIKLIRRGKFIGGISSTAKYSRFVEEGTRPHLIRIKSKRVLANKKGNQIFGPTVWHPGTRANPFMSRSAKKSENKIQKIFNKAMDRVAKHITK